MSADITIQADATWSQSLWLLDGNLPVDLTGKQVELHVRPVLDYPAALRVLTSADGGEIAIDNAVKGAITITVTQANVAANLPVGLWEYFLRVVGTDVIEYQRGNLTVLAGRTS